MRDFKALLIEDDLLFQETLKDFLDDNGICTSVESDGDNGFSTFENENPDIVILDIILPNKTGFEILREIREVNKSVPIILMTGTEFDEQSQILGYELGIVNYLKKPILPQVLLAQIKNLLAIPKDLKVFKIKGSEIVFHKQSVSINNKDIDLREKDSQLLKLLLENESLTLSRSDILVSLWGSDDVQLNNALDRTILRIRTELKAFKHITIETIYGVGYGLSVC